MAVFDEDCLAQLDDLEREIVELTRADPKLRIAHQQVRAAFSIAEALSHIFALVDIPVSHIAETALVSNEQLSAALSASPEFPPTVDFVAAVCYAASFKFELQFIPESSAPETDSGSQEITIEGVPGGVLVRFGSPLDKRANHSALASGLKRLISKSGEPLEFSRLAPLLGRDVELWELVHLADDAAFKLQFRFAPITSHFTVDFPSPSLPGPVTEYSLSIADFFDDVGSELRVPKFRGKIFKTVGG